MKRIILFLALGLLWAGGANAQRSLPGTRGVALQGGIAGGEEGSFYAGAAVESYARNSNRWVAGAQYLHRRYGYDTGRIPVVQYTGEAGYFKHLWADPSRTVYLSVGGSALAGYEVLNKGRRILPDGAMLTSDDGFVYGLAATIELEGYAADRIVVCLTVRQRAMWGSAAGQGCFQAGIGIKYKFN